MVGGLLLFSFLPFWWTAADMKWRIKVGVLEVLFLIFLTLKLTGTIAWSWWWVFAPLYPAILLYAVVIFALLFGAFSGTLTVTRK
jgi:hypothetical protein